MKKDSFTILFLFIPILLMAQTNNINKDFLQSFADAFNAHDLKAIMSHMTDDCVFEASAGPDFDGERGITCGDPLEGNPASQITPSFASLMRYFYFQPVSLRQASLYRLKIKIPQQAAGVI